MKMSGKNRIGLPIACGLLIFAMFIGMNHWHEV